MGAQPKKKRSHAKTGSRRFHDRLSIGAIVLCSHCRRPHIAHHVCRSCGFYAGREAVPEKPVRAPAE